jgi:hypothetical protein
MIITALILVIIFTGWYESKRNPLFDMWLKQKIAAVTLWVASVLDSVKRGMK